MNNSKKEGLHVGGWRRAGIAFVASFLFFLTYAYVRYIVIKGESAANLPLYLSNKAIALASVVLIGLSFLLGSLAKFWPKKFEKTLYLRKYFGVSGFAAASFHAISSLILFTPSYYPKLFSAEGKLTLSGELSMVSGILALFIFSAAAVTSLPSVEESMSKRQWFLIQRTGYLAFFLVMLHVFFMGIQGWLTPAKWPGGLLPLSLIAFVLIAIVLIMKFVTVWKD
ncbi:ferric reductase-like transmembrane domain-containing protein [Candidatus Roizmanbacteria bacterium]|nr:ferric reductase-like transmembrane domain-containing protein [Candidatus Roizmanbacteria bacterium]